MKWMNLEPIIQSEISQKDRDKYHILTHVYGIQKDGTDKFICREVMEKSIAETYMQVRKQQLELDMEQQTGSKQEKEYVKAVYCHPAYLTYIQSTS